MNTLPYAISELRKANDRLERANRRSSTTMRPAAPVFKHAADMLASVPERKLPVCARCDGEIKLRGQCDPRTQNWFHEFCFEQVKALALSTSACDRPKEVPPPPPAPAASALSGNVT